jgi:hypothetical protein
MAKVKDPLHSLQASGSIGGYTHQNWRGIGVVREKPVPTQPNSFRQTATRSIMTQLARKWADELTEGIRIAWKNFADVFVWTDIFGKELRLTGINLFTKINFQLKDAGKTLQETPPPPIKPSEFSFFDIDKIDGEMSFDITSPGISEINSQSPFLDLWIAGLSGIISVVEDPTTTLINVKSAGMPQGVNPVRSDFRHLIYQSQTVEAGPPEVARTIRVNVVDITEAAFIGKRKIALLVRRYNKHGNYSTTKKFAEIVQP